MARQTFKAEMLRQLKKRRLSKDTMHRFVNNHTARGFRKRLEQAAKDFAVQDRDVILKDVPEKPNVSETTVWRWMKVCGGKWGRHKQGFTDRRNHSDIVDDVQRYIHEMAKHQQRMSYFLEQLDSYGTTKKVLWDRLRSKNEKIERCETEIFEKLTWNIDRAGEQKQPHPTRPGYCVNGHLQTPPQKCKCDKKIVHIGHDEAVFWCNLLSTREWTIDGNRQLRPKNPGKGVMVSAMIDEERGFGIPVTDEEWQKIQPIVEEFQREHTWFRIEEPVNGQKRKIGLILFDYGGANGDRNNALTSGYWTCAKFTVQCEFVIKCYEVLAPNVQLLLQMDQSSGHTSKGAHALNANSVNLTDGGLKKKQAAPGLRNTKVDKRDLGPHLGQPDTPQPPGMVDKSQDEPDQFGCYPPTNDPSRYDNCGPHFRINDDKVVTFQVEPDWYAGMNVDVDLFQHIGLRVPPKRVVLTSEDIANKCGSFQLEEPGNEWWRGMRKGALQLLYETGHIDPNITKYNDAKALFRADWAPKRPPTPEEKAAKQYINAAGEKEGKKVARQFLKDRVDFKNEKSVIEQLFLDNGHLCIASPKYHPEVAGLGIEYCWGKAKLEFRRYVNDCIAANLKKNILIATGETPYDIHGNPENGQRLAPLPVERTRRFARRARDLLRLFSIFPTPEKAEAFLAKWKNGEMPTSLTDAEGKKIVFEKLDAHEDAHGMLRKLYNLNKTHCNALDVFHRFCDRC